LLLNFQPMELYESMRYQLFLADNTKVTSLGISVAVFLHVKSERHVLTHQWEKVFCRSKTWMLLSYTTCLHFSREMLEIYDMSVVCHIEHAFQQACLVECRQHCFVLLVLLYSDF